MSMETLLWNGAINVIVNFKEKRYYTRVLRNSFIHFYLSDILQYFQVSQKADVWLEYDDVPVKWNIPIGVLYDLLTQSHETWELNLHTTEYPRELLLPIGNVYDQWLHCWKQACHAMHGSSKLVMSFSKSQTDDLWNSVQPSVHDHELYNSVVRSLTNKPKRFAIKIHVVGRTLQFPSDLNNSISSLVHKAVLEVAQYEMSYSITCHGIDIPADTLVSKLSPFIYIDGFIHLTVAI